MRLCDGTSEHDTIKKLYYHIALKQKSFVVFVDQSVTTKLCSEIMINAVCNRVWPYKATM